MSKDAQCCVGAEGLLSPIRGCVLRLSFGKLEQVADKEVIAVVLLLSLFGKVDFGACLWVWRVGRVI